MAVREKKTNDNVNVIVRGIIIIAILTFLFGLMRFSDFRDKIIEVIPWQKISDGNNEMPPTIEELATATDATTTTTTTTTTETITMTEILSTSIESVSETITEPIQPFIFDDANIISESQDFDNVFRYNNGTLPNETAFIARINTGSKSSSYRVVATNTDYRSLNIKYGVSAKTNSKDIFGNNHFKVIGILSDGSEKILYDEAVNPTQPPTAKTFNIEQYEFIKFLVETNEYYTNFDIVIESEYHA